MRFILHDTRERETECARSNNTQEAAHASYRGNRSWLINLLRGHKFDAVNSDRFLYTWHPEKDVYGIYAFSSVHLFHALTHDDAEKRSSLSYTVSRPLCNTDPLAMASYQACLSTFPLHFSSYDLARARVQSVSTAIIFHFPSSASPPFIVHHIARSNNVSATKVWKRFERVLIFN